MEGKHLLFKNERISNEILELIPRIEFFPVFIWSKRIIALFISIWITNQILGKGKIRINDCIFFKVLIQTAENYVLNNKQCKKRRN